MAAAALERLEDALEIAAGDTRTGVGDFKLGDLAAIAYAQRDRAVLGVLDRVREQIDQDL